MCSNLPSTGTAVLTTGGYLPHLCVSRNSVCGQKYWTPSLAMPSTLTKKCKTARKVQYQWCTQQYQYGFTVNGDIFFFVIVNGDSFSL